MRTLQLLFFLFTALPLFGQASATYVGAQACARCHAAASHDWASSPHYKIFQPANEQSVRGDFSQGKIVLHGSTYLLQRQNGNYYITESELSGKAWQHQVEYTLGSRRVQHYLATLSDGRIVVLPATWDVLRRAWVHNLDIENPEESTGQEMQVWNKSCYGCHVSREKKNFDLQQNRYRTTWQNLGVSCETCHGPGSDHVQAALAKVLNAEARAKIRATILNPARLDPLRSSMLCAQCHSFRDIYVDDFRAGANYNDYFLLVMQYRLPTQDSAYWPDGRPRWISNEAAGLWQSQCFLKGGATCVTCHTQGHDVAVARNPQLHPTNNALCLGCHTAIGKNVAAHTHHDANGPGSSCVECHMPRVVISLRAEMRDHSMSIPVPENTARHDVPNACNICHEDKDPNWAMVQMNKWYGPRSRQCLVQRADAFSGAAGGDSTAVPALLQILGDTSESPVIRANAAGYLGSFPDDPSAYAAMLDSLSDPEAIVRQTAVLSIRPRAAQRAVVAPILASLLRDPVRTVEVSAAIALVEMGVRELPPEDQEWFENAKKLYAARAELNSDAAQQEFAAGRFFYLAGDMDRAIVSFRAAMKLDPSVSAKYYLGRALAEKKDYQSAQQILNTIPANDPQYAAAQQLLAQIELKARENAAEPNQNGPTSSAEADVRFQEGQTLYQDQNYGGALKPLQDALRLAPQAPWAIKAQIYRAVCMAKQSRFEEAQSAMKALEANPAAREDTDFQLAWAEMLYETSRSEDALKRVDNFIAAVPNAPMAYFWRAKVLLQLGRTEEAAKAAEESIRLLPEAPAAHNLLIRIYQMLGRLAEAAQQAQWVRAYERRMQSR